MFVPFGSPVQIHSVGRDAYRLSTDFLDVTGGRTKKRTPDYSHTRTEDRTPAVSDVVVAAVAVVAVVVCLLCAVNPFLPKRPTMS